MTRIRRRIVPAALLVLVATACSGAGGINTSTTTVAPSTSAVVATTTTAIDPAVGAARLEDLEFLHDRIISTHPNPFWRSGEEAYLEQLEGTKEQAGTMTDREFGLEVIRLVALIDGHSLAMTDSPPLDFQRFQIRSYLFDDGLHVLNSHDPAAIGGRVLAIGDVPTHEAIARIEPYIHRDNEMTVRLITPTYLTYVELLEGIGILTDGAPAFTIEAADGTMIELDPPKLSSDELIDWLGGSPTGLHPRGTQTEAESAAPLYLTYSDRAFWWTHLDDSGTLYIQMNRVTDLSTDPDGGHMSLRRMAGDIETFLDETAVDRVVLDLRHNPGGDNTTYGPLLDLLSTHPDINQAGKLYVFVGRNTFSAAMNLSTELENKTEAIYAGERTGARPNLYGDTATSHLPNSGITVRISARYWPFAGPDDTRAWIEPTIDVPLRATDYFAGRDPVLDAVIAFEA